MPEARDADAGAARPASPPCDAGSPLPVAGSDAAAPGIDPALAGQSHRYFAIRVLDRADRSPLPAARLETTHHLVYLSDREGRVAFYEPGLMGADVYFTVSASGHELAADAFGFRGTALHTDEGGSAELLLDKTSDMALPEADDSQSRLLQGPVAGRAECCAIRVIDAESRRGVPLVFVDVAGEQYVTDSQGFVAFCDPNRLGRSLELSLSSHGYRTLVPSQPQVLEAGKQLELAIERSNLARRLYRSTGAGIYRDSLRLGLRTPLERPALNAFVTGQDTVNAVVYKGSVFWIWGDTNRLSYPLGNFRTTGARSQLPERGGLDPRFGVDYAYFSGDDGFARPMVEDIEPTGQPTWLGSMLSLPAADGVERLFALYSKPMADLSLIERGLVRFDDAKQLFTRTGVEYPLTDYVAPDGQPVVVHHEAGDHAYFGSPLRIPARAEAMLDPDQYEVWTALDDETLRRGSDGALDYAYRHGALATTAQQLKDASIPADQALDGHAQDGATGQALSLAGAGALSWNLYRQRFVRVVQQLGGDSFLGELWYFEGDTPFGPWVFGRKVVSHVDYTFYNPWLHPYFASRAGATILFEATYTKSFAGKTTPLTPQYDYNQQMYELDLDDERLALPVPVYDISVDDNSDYAVKQALRRGPGRLAPAFFAFDRSAPNSAPAYWSGPACAKRELRIGGTPTTPPVFHVLASRSNNPVVVPLYDYATGDGHHLYGTDGQPSTPGVTRARDPIAYVWPTPIRVRLPVDDFLGDLVADAGADQCVIESSQGAGVDVELAATATRNLTGKTLHYAWKRQLGTCPDAQGVETKLQLPVGTHTLWLEVSDDNGQVSTDSLIIEVAAGP